MHPERFLTGFAERLGPVIWRGGVSSLIRKSARVGDVWLVNTTDTAAYVELASHEVLGHFGV